MRLSSWPRDQLPEVLWIGLLIECWGQRVGTDIAVTLAQVASTLTVGEKKMFYAVASTFNVLPTNALDVIKSKSQELGFLKQAQVALEPLVRIYSAFPLSFLGMPSAADVHLDGEQRLRRTLQQLFDKTSVLAMRTFAAAVYIAFVTDKLKVRKGLGFEDFPKIVDYPSPSVPGPLPATIRATFGVLAGNALEELKVEWANKFWQRGLEYSACTVRAAADE